MVPHPQIKLVIKVAKSELQLHRRSYRRHIVLNLFSLVEITKKMAVGFDPSVFRSE